MDQDFGDETRTVEEEEQEDGAEKCERKKTMNDNRLLRMRKRHGTNQSLTQVIAQLCM